MNNSSEQQLTIIASLKSIERGINGKLYLNMGTTVALLFENGIEIETIYGVKTETLFGKKLLRAYRRNFKEILIMFEQIHHIVELNRDYIEIHI